MANTTNTETQKPQSKAARAKMNAMEALEAARAKLGAMKAREAAYFSGQGPHVYSSRTARLYMRLLADRVERPRFPRISGPFSSWEYRALFNLRTGQAFGTGRNNQRQPNGKQWFEDYESAGLHLLAYCDEIADIGHGGWFVDDDQLEVIRGAVFVVRGRDPHGYITLVAGYEDHNNPGAALIDWSASGTVQPPQDADGYWSLKDTDEAHAVAFWADRLARCSAEEMREDDAKYRAEQKIETLKEDTAELRKELRALLGELRTVRSALESAPAVVAALRGHIAQIRAERSENLQAIRKFRENPWEACPGY